MVDHSAQATLFDFFQDDYRVEQVRLTSPSAIADYEQQIRNFDRFTATIWQEPKHAARAPQLAERGQLWQAEHAERKPEEWVGLVTLEDLNNRLVSLVMHHQRSRKSPAAANKLQRVICALWRLAWRKEMLDTIPRVAKMPEYVEERRVWTPAQFQKALDTAATLTGHVGDVPAAIWWSCCLSVFAVTACRRRAVLGLSPEAVDLDRNEIYVPAALQKQKRGRFYALPPFARMALQQHLRYVTGGERLLPWPMTDIILTRHLRKRILKPAGLPTGPKDLFHGLRAMTGTWLTAKHGIEYARNFLDHSSVNVTKGYLDNSQTSERRTASDVFEQFTIDTPGMRVVG